MLEIAMDRDKCSGCAFCVLACPQNVFEFDYDTTKAYVANPTECIVCRNCEEQCPKNIIQVRLTS
jgi:2-oxoglutarate ferredoxin oxidoreductase subunit delta